jgi:hypothetical protein
MSRLLCCNSGGLDNHPLQYKFSNTNFISPAAAITSAAVAGGRTKAALWLNSGSLLP